MTLTPSKNDVLAVSPGSSGGLPTLTLGRPAHGKGGLSLLKSSIAQLHQSTNQRQAAMIHARNDIELVTPAFIRKSGGGWRESLNASQVARGKELRRMEVLRKRSRRRADQDDDGDGTAVANSDGTDVIDATADATSTSIDNTSRKHSSRGTSDTATEDAALDAELLQKRLNYQRFDQRELRALIEDYANGSRQHQLAVKNDLKSGRIRSKLAQHIQHTNVQRSPHTIHIRRYSQSNTNNNATATNSNDATLSNNSDNKRSSTANSPQVNLRASVLSSHTNNVQEQSNNSIDNTNDSLLQQRQQHLTQVAVRYINPLTMQFTITSPPPIHINALQALHATISFIQPLPLSSRYDQFIALMICPVTISLVTTLFWYIHCIYFQNSSKDLQYVLLTDCAWLYARMTDLLDITLSLPASTGVETPHYHHHNQNKSHNKSISSYNNNDTSSNKHHPSSSQHHVTDLYSHLSHILHDHIQMSLPLRHVYTRSGTNHSRDRFLRLYPFVLSDAVYTLLTSLYDTPLPKSDKKKSSTTTSSSSGTSAASSRPLTSEHDHHSHSSENEGEYQQERTVMSSILSLSSFRTRLDNDLHLLLSGFHITPMTLSKERTLFLKPRTKQDYRVNGCGFFEFKHNHQHQAETNDDNTQDDDHDRHGQDGHHDDNDGTITNSNNVGDVGTTIATAQEAKSESATEVINWARAERERREQLSRRSTQSTNDRTRANSSSSSGRASAAAIASLLSPASISADMSLAPIQRELLLAEVHCHGGTYHDEQRLSANIHSLTPLMQKGLQRTTPSTHWTKYHMIQYDTHANFVGNGRDDEESCDESKQAESVMSSAWEKEYQAIRAECGYRSSSTRQHKNKKHVTAVAAVTAAVADKDKDAAATATDDADKHKAKRYDALAVLTPRTRKLVSKYSVAEDDKAKNKAPVTLTTDDGADETTSVVPSMSIVVEADNTEESKRT